MALTALNVIFCISFLGFAYVNLNDNDAWLWVSIYMAVCICCGLAAFKKFYPKIYLLLIAFYLVYAVIIFFSEDGLKDWLFKYKRPSIVETMQANKLYIEKAREFFGLIIISAALLIDYIFAKYVYKGPI